MHEKSSVERLIKLVLLLSLILLLMMPKLMAAEKGSVALNTETLSGGIIHGEGMYLPRGLNIPCVLRTPIDTRVSRQGDMVTVQTTEDILLGEYAVIPANSFLHGYISALEGPGKWHKAAEVDISFDTISVPGESGKRRYVPIHGRIHHKAVLAAAERVNDSGATFKQRMKKPAAVGALTGGLGTWLAIHTFTPFSTFGIDGLINKAVIGSGFVGGAMLATSLIDKDDIRIEPGTDLVVMLEGATMEAFQEEAPLSHNQVKDMAPADAYDRYDEMRSLPLERKGSHRSESPENKYLTAI